MKKRGVIIGLLLAIGLVLVGFQGVGFAADAICTIDKVMQTNTETKLMLTEESQIFKDKIFLIADGPNLNKILSLALTAYSMDDKVKVFFNSSNRIASIHILK